MKLVKVIRGSCPTLLSLSLDLLCYPKSVPEGSLGDISYKRNPF